MSQFEMSVSTYNVLRRAWDRGLTPFATAIICVATILDVEERQVINAYRRIYMWEIASPR